MRGFAMLIVCAGCRQLLGFDSPTHEVVGDAAPDTPDAPPDAAAMCFGSGAYAFCLPAPPTGSPVLPSLLFTDVDALCLPQQPSEWTTASQPPACFIVGANITVPLGSKIVAAGTRPLVIVGGSSLVIEGVIDVASHVNGSDGAGMGTSMNCPSFATNTGNAAAGNGGPGGAGGTFMTKGGNGGTGGAGGGGGHAGTELAQPPGLLRGGCVGQDGGNGNGGTSNGGAAGAGGGAVYLVSGGMITIAGVVNASGAGAQGANKYGGGAGGGTGGMIVLWSPRYAGSGVLIANGGGGSSGGDGNASGVDGSNPNPLAPFTPAAGGTSSTGGRPGGNGFAHGIAATSGLDGTAANGGGGGGGGGGYIQANLAIAGASISPDLTVVP